MSRGRASSSAGPVASGSGSAPTSKHGSANGVVAPPLMTSEEVNVLVHAYLEESGFTHTAFSLLHESPLGTDQLPDDTVVPPAHLLRILQKGLLYMSAEAMYRGEDTSRPPRLIGYAVNETLPLPAVPEALGEEDRKLVAEVRARGEGKSVEVQTDEVVPPTPPPPPVVDRKGKGKAREDQDVEMEDAEAKKGVEVGIQTETDLLEEIRKATETAPKVNGDATESEKVERPAKPSRTGTSERLDKPSEGDKPTSKGTDKAAQKRPPGKADRQDSTASSSKLAVPSNSNKPLTTKRKASNDAITDDSGKRAKTRDGDSLPSPADKESGPAQPSMSANSTVKIIRSTIRAPDASASANKRRSMSPTATRNPGTEKRFVIPGQKGSAAPTSATGGASNANRARSNSVSQKPSTPGTSGPSKATNANASLQPKGTPAKEKSKSRSPAPPKGPPAAQATNTSTAALANGKVDGGAGRAIKSVGQDSELQLHGHQASSQPVVWHPKQPNYLATGAGDHTMRVWDVPATWQPGQVVPSSVSCKHSSTQRRLDVTMVHWNPEGTLIATGADDGVCRIWTPSGDLLQVLSMHQKSIHSLQWTPNGTSLVTGSLDNTVCLWDLNMGKVKQQWATHQNSQTLLEVEVFDDTTFVTCSNDKIIHMLAHGRQHPVHRFKGHTDDVNIIKLNPSKSLLASGGDDGGVRVWSLVGVAPGVSSPSDATDGEVEDGEEVDGDDEKSRKKRLASRGGSVLMQHGGEVVTLAWSKKDPKLLASGSGDGLVRLWNIETGEAVLDITRHREHICTLEFQPGREDFFASASTDCTMCIWRLSDMALAFEYKHNGPIYSIAWHPTKPQIAVTGLPHDNAIVDVSSLSS